MLTLKQTVSVVVGWYRHFYVSAPMGEVVPNSEHKKIAHAEIYTSYSMFMYQEPIKAAINTMAINPRKITLQPTAKSESPAFLY